MVNKSFISKNTTNYFRYWISHFPVYFDLHHELSDAVQQLQEWVRKEEEDNTELSDLIDVSKVYVVCKH